MSSYQTDWYLQYRRSENTGILIKVPITPACDKEEYGQGKNVGEAGVKCPQSLESTRLSCKLVLCRGSSRDLGREGRQCLFKRSSRVLIALYLGSSAPHSANRIS